MYTLCIIYIVYSRMEKTKPYLLFLLIIKKLYKPIIIVIHILFKKIYIVNGLKKKIF